MGRYIYRIAKGCISAIKRKCKQIVAKLYSLLPLVYNSLDKISLERWFKIMNGEFKYFNKFNISYVPLFFYKKYVEFIYQMENFDLTLLKKKGDQAILNSTAAITKNKGYQFKADSLQKEIEKIQEENKNDKNISLNDFIDFIELNLGLHYNIDPSRISASRGYSLFNKAKDKVIVINKRTRKNGRNSTK